MVINRRRPTAARKVARRRAGACQKCVHGPARRISRAGAPGSTPAAANQNALPKNHFDPGARLGALVGYDGKLYGTTSARGTSGYGSVFELQPPSVTRGTWTETILYSLKSGSDGSHSGRIGDFWHE